MPLMGFQKKKKNVDRGVGGWVELYPNYFWIFGIFLTLQSPLRTKRFVVISFFIVVSSVELLLRRKCPRANMFCDNVPTALGGRPTSGAFDIELFWFDTEKSYQYPKL